MSHTLRLACAVLGTAALVAGYAWGPVGAWAPLFSLLVLPWLLGRWPRLRWMPSLGFVLSIVAAALGAALGGPAGWMVLGAILALAAWDLDAFHERLQSAEAVHGQDELERRHRARLLSAALVGGLLAALALELRIELGFGTLLLLGLLAIAGVSQAIRFLRQAGG